MHDRLAEAEHIVVSRRGRLRDPIDETLVGMGLRHRVVASAPTSTAALHIPTCPARSPGACPAST